MQHLVPHTRSYLGSARPSPPARPHCQELKLFPCSVSQHGYDLYSILLTLHLHFRTVTAI